VLDSLTHRSDVGSGGQRSGEAVVLIYFVCQIGKAGWSARQILYQSQ
jgi:hypothetical protein